MSDRSAISEWNLGRESSRPMAQHGIVSPMAYAMLRAIHGVMVGQVGPEGILSAHAPFWSHGHTYV